MGLPFKNGYELAKAMGFGDMYQASKEEKEEVVENIKNLMRKIHEYDKNKIQDVID